MKSRDNLHFRTMWTYCSSVELNGLNVKKDKIESGGLEKLP